MDNQSTRYRFPGVDTFTSNDADIFCGRYSDTENLYTQIMLSETVVLHADSGTGKSSLVNAGLLPLITKRSPDLLPIYIRFQGQKKTEVNKLNYSYNGTESLAQEVLNAFKLKKNLQAPNLPFIASQKKDLWYEAKLFQANQKSLLLIFDQFEDIQSYNFKQTEHFKEQLALLFSSTIPEKHYQNIRNRSLALADGADDLVEEEYRKTYNEGIKVLRGPLKIKALFVIREDKLGTLSLLSDRFPDILKNDYRLSPLSKEAAWKAIDEPPKVDGRFLSPKFEFDEIAIRYILKKLYNSTSNSVDPIELQIICRHIENEIINTFSKTTNPPSKIKITKRNLPPIHDIITSFYIDCWKKVKQRFGLTDKEIDKKRKSIIEELVVNEKRIQVFEGYFVDQDIQILNELVFTGLLRRIPIGKDHYYQLSHDRMIRPSLEDLAKLKAEEELERKNEEEKRELEHQLAIAEENKKRQLEAAERRRLEIENAYQKEKALTNKKRTIYLSIFSGSLIILVGLSIYLWLIARQENIFSVARTIKKINPTLSYIVAKDWASDNITTPEFRSFLKSYDSTSYAYLIGSYAHPHGIVSAHLSRDKTELVVADNSAIYNWSRDGVLVGGKVFGDRIILKSFELNGQSLFAVQSQDSLMIADINGVIIKKFPKVDDRNIEVSNDGKYIIIGSSLFNYVNGELIENIPVILKDSKDQMASIFLNNSEHLAVGYWSGDILIFNINEQRSDAPIKLVKFFPTTSMNNVITSLAVDKNNNFIVSGNRQNEAEVWSIGDLVESISLDSVVAEADRAAPGKILKGHTNEINSVAISKDGKYILTGSNDNTAILWNTEDGEKASILKGSANHVVYVNFSSNGTELITGDKDGQIFLWQRGAVSKLYNKNELATFTPFEYYNIWLKEYTPERVYKQSGIISLFGGTLHYISHIPKENLVPDDNDYLNNLKKAIHEATSMYNSLITNPEFSDSISLPNKRILYNSYALLVLNEPKLLLKADHESKIEKFHRYAKHHHIINKALLLDTTQIETAKFYISEYRTILDFLGDSTTNHERNIMYHKEVLNLINAFIKKNPSDIDLINDCIIFNNDLAAAYLYSKKVDSAEIVASRMLKIKGGTEGMAEGLANGVLIRVYLLSNRYTKAQDLFLKNENKEIEKGRNLSYKEFLLPRLEKMKNKGLNNPDIEKFLLFLEKRPTPIFGS